MRECDFRCLHLFEILEVSEAAFQFFNSYSKPCLLISQPYHIFPLAVLSARIKALRSFHLPISLVLQRHEQKSLKFNSLASWLFFKRHKTGRRQNVQLHIPPPPPTDTITASGEQRRWEDVGDRDFYFIYLFQKGALQHFCKSASISHQTAVLLARC